MQRFGLAIAMLLALAPWAPWAAEAQQRRLDTTTFVAVGEGLAAGMANYGLIELYQDKSFPAQMARQMNTAFPQPLMEGPGVGTVLGYAQLPVRLPSYPQTRVRLFPSKAVKNDEAPTLFVFNLSVPGLRLEDSLTRRPTSPLIQDDVLQTAINMILGFPALILERRVPLWTQLEYARAMMPTFAVVELGYFDVLEAVVAGDPTQIPAPSDFRVNYSKVVRDLRAVQAEVLVTTIPDPVDTAYFISPATAAQLLASETSTVLESYGLSPDDFVTRDGLVAISNQFIKNEIGPLPPRSTMTAAAAADISSRVAALNAEINSVASENGALVADLRALFRLVRTQGINAGSRRLTGEYMGGFYSLDGFYPGHTGQALIANEILILLNRVYGEAFPLLNTTAIAQSDPVAGQRGIGEQ